MTEQNRLLIETEHILEGIGFNWELSHRHRIARELIAKTREMTLREVGELVSRLLNAARAGECPDPECPICKSKQETIREAEAKLKEWGEPSSKAN